MFQRALRNEFRRRGLKRSAIAVVTQVLVDRADPAFAAPAKPIGSYMDEETARRRAAELGWIVREDAGRGWRRVVPSPLPRGIVEIDEIEHLVSAGYVVIACGGGGIPVFQGDDGDLHGVEAVIDKDLAAALIGGLVRARTLLLLTGVEQVALDFGTPRQRPVDVMRLSEARAHMADGQFPPGSMGPKVDAAIRFVEAGGREAIITSLERTADAIAGSTGTRVVR
jgi:carbamate kinase